MSDLISRQAAIDALAEHEKSNCMKTTFKKLLKGG